VGASLTWLEMNANSLSAIPPEIGHMTALTHLSAGSNNIASLPPEYAFLTFISFLNDCVRVRWCVCVCVLTICTRCDRIGNLKNLTSLMLFYTQLQTLPDEFCALLNLKTLHLGANEVRNQGRLQLCRCCC
jgi:Leucine-rich repeat (LRR) protein